MEDIAWIIEKWLDRHPEIRKRRHEIRALSGRWTTEDGLRNEVITVSIIAGDDIAGYDPEDDADIYEYWKLERIPSVFFSVSLSAAGTEEERKEAKKYVTDFLEQTNWHPGVTATFGGGLLNREYGFLKRWIMKKIAMDSRRDTDTPKNHIYTERGAVDQFALHFVERLTER